MEIFDYFYQTAATYLLARGNCAIINVLKGEAILWAK